MPVQLFYGNEPYCLEYEKKKQRKAENALDIGVFTEWGQEVEQMAGTCPLLGEKPIIFLEIEKLGANEEMLRFFEDTPDSHISIFAETADKNTKLYKWIKKNGLVKECNKLREQDLKKWIAVQCKRKGFQITEDAAAVLIYRTGYYNSNTCNLYTVQNYLYQLGYAYETITKELVEAFIEPTVEEKAFSLGKMLFSKDKRLFMSGKRLLENGESPIAMLSILLRLYRLAYKASLYPEKNEKELEQLLGVKGYQYADARKYSPQVLREGMTTIQKAVGQIKAGYPTKEVYYVTLAQLYMGLC